MIPDKNNSSSANGTDACMTGGQLRLKKLIKYKQDRDTINNPIARALFRLRHPILDCGTRTQAKSIEIVELRDKTTHLESDVKKKTSQINALEQIIERVLSKIDDKAAMFNALAEETRTHFGYTYATVFLVDEKTKANVLVALSGYSPEDGVKKGFTLNPGQGVSGWVIANGEPKIVNNVESDPLYVGVRAGIKSNLSAPIKDMDGSTIGAITVESTEINAFNGGSVSQLSVLANMASLALRNAEIVKELQLANRQLGKANKDLKFLAYHDQLTSLYNQHYIYKDLAHRINQAKKDGTWIVMFYLDINWLKEINDAHGHGVADEAIQKFAQIFLEVTAKFDKNATVARRYGGDEFVIIVSMENMPDEDVALKFGEQLKAEIDNFVDKKELLQDLPMRRKPEEQRVRTGITYGFHIFGQAELVAESDGLATQSSAFLDRQISKAEQDMWKRKNGAGSQK